MEETNLAVPESNKRKDEDGWFEIDEKHNTNVYVSGLPTNISEEDFIDLMKKCGVIKKELPPNNSYKIKLYKNPDGSLKGDAVCSYARIESVQLALEYLDGLQYDDKHTLHCEQAKFELKGTYDKSRKRPKTLDKKSKMKRKNEIDKILSWEEKEAPVVKQTRVILKHMFAPDEILQDATTILDLKEDVESRCITLSCEPKRVDIYDKHPEGVVAITFAEASQAELCVKALDNDYYAGRVVKAELWDGKTKYKIKETDEETEKRLAKWHEDIQKSDDDDDAAEKAVPTTSSESTEETCLRGHSEEDGVSPKTDPLDPN